MKIAVLFIVLFSSGASFSQNYLQYYEGINRAKNAIIEDNPKKAVDAYLETFEQFDFVFARDCFNALEVASSIDDISKIDYFSRRCLTQGIEFDRLEKDSLLVKYQTTELWPILLSDIDSLKQVYIDNVNWGIRKEINSMFTEDQKIRDLATKNRFNIFKIGKLKKQFVATDERLVKRLVEITKEYGFPGEQLIGIDHDSMHPKVKTRLLTAGMPMVILIHYYSQPSESYNDLFASEIRTGYLFNEHYATLCDFQHSYSKQEDIDSLCYSLMFRPKLNVNIIDSNRQKIKLLSTAKTRALYGKKLITPKYYLY